MKDTKLSDISKRVHSLVDHGYSKSELARTLEVSRSTLIHLLTQKGFSPSKTILNRIENNLNWIERNEKNPTLEALILLYFKHHNLAEYFNVVSDQAADLTGFKLGYHGMTTGRPVGFLIVHSPGIDPVMDLYSKCHHIFPKNSYGRTETMLLANRARYSSNHEAAFKFYEANPNARIYLALFYSYSFTADQDMEGIKKLFFESKFADETFLIESGFIAGRYDYFFLFMTKDEQTYHRFNTDRGGIYEVCNQSQTESTVLTISPQGRPIFTPEYFNLSFSDNQRTK